jgi:hypothetical protein
MPSSQSSVDSDTPAAPAAASTPATTTTTPRTAAKSRNTPKARTPRVRTVNKLKDIRTPTILTDEHVDNGLDILNTLHTQRMAQYESIEPRTDLEEIHQQMASENPIMQKFFRKNGSTTIQLMTNFTMDQFTRLWMILSSDIQKNWNTGRGRRSPHTPMDVLFFTLTVLKHGGKWDTMAQIFDIKTATFEKIIMSFIHAVAPKMYHRLVSQVLKDYSMERLCHMAQRFRCFPSALYATDVHFQEANRPGSSSNEGIDYFNSKFGLYGFKQEISVLPIGLAVTASGHAEGSKSDHSMFVSRMALHQALLQKKGEEVMIPDRDKGVHEFPDSWAVLCEHGDEVGRHHLRMIHSVQSDSSQGVLAIEEELHSKRVAEDRIVVKKYLGRMCHIWGICSNKYRWSEDMYDSILQMCIAVTNFHVGFNPLRSEDSFFYAQYTTRLSLLGADIVNKRRQKQARYREKRQRVLEQVDASNVFTEAAQP